MYARLVTVVRLIFGVQMMLSGLNWWVKLTLYPSISDFAHSPPPDNILGALVATGYLFHVVKGVELVMGLAILFDVFVPLVLVVGFPVTLGVFATDALSHPHLRGLLMGSGDFTQHVFLLFAYFSYYRPMFVMEAEPDAARATLGTAGARSFGGALMPPFSVLAVCLGVIDLGILATLIFLHLTGRSS
jgi:uncharacterized membrane protein YphA (DoxX/SURF4 family)